MFVGRTLIERQVEGGLCINGFGDKVADLEHFMKEAVATFLKSNQQESKQEYATTPSMRCALDVRFRHSFR